jgi:hypothetical protein
MPNVSPNAPTIAPGVAGSTSGYPQWGVGGGKPGTSSGWQIVEVTTSAQKTVYVGEGYAVWFTSQSAAKSYLSSEENPLESGEPSNAIPGLAQIGDFFGALTGKNTWIRVGKVVLGGALIIYGVNRATGGAVTKTAKTAGAAALL